jgi:hypothetical protein
MKPDEERRWHHLLEPLKEVPPPDPRRIQAARNWFLLEARRIRLQRAESPGPLMRLYQQIATPSRRRRFSMVQLIIAIVIALSAATGGVVYAADGAAPGDLLYGLDRALEQLQLSFTDQPEAELALRLRLAEERLQEARELLQRGKTEQVEELLHEYVATIRWAENALQLEVTTPSLDTTQSLRLSLEGQGEQLKELQVQIEEQADIQLDLLVDQAADLQLSIERQIQVPAPPGQPEGDQPGAPVDAPPQDLPGGPPEEGEIPSPPSSSPDPGAGQGEGYGDYTTPEVPTVPPLPLPGGGG